jgi:hypothetical protein
MGSRRARRAQSASCAANMASHTSCCGALAASRRLDRKDRKATGRTCKSSQVKSSRRLPMNDAGITRRHTQFGEVRTHYLFGTAYAGTGE